MQTQRVTSRPKCYWSQPPEALLSALESHKDGLCTAEAEKRLKDFGPNTLVRERKLTGLTLFFGEMKSPLVLILIFAGILSAALREWVDAINVFFIVIVSAILTSFQEYRADRAVEKLRERLVIKAQVYRDGKMQPVPAEEVVPGDVVFLRAGSLIPADGVVIEAKDFFVNQAALTGESFPAEKKPGQAEPKATLAERTNCVFMGSSVRSGSGRVLMVETGAATSYGQIAKRLNLRRPETDFERGIRHFGFLLTQVMTFLVLAVFAINIFTHKPVVESMLFSVAIAVGLAPELLPAIISLTLANGAQVMAKAGVIVRRLSSIENLGSMDVLCSDKTGTLTEGVVRMDAAIDIKGKPSERVFRHAYLNAHLQTGLNNPLDEAVIAQGDSHFAELISQKKICKVDEVPFDFVRRRLSVVVTERSQAGFSSRYMVTKGALENVLEVCTRIQNGEMDTSLDRRQLAEMANCFAEWSSQGYRVLGVASKRVREQAAYTCADECDMVFDGFLLFFDPPKKDIKQTLTTLAEQGVQLKIITGDNRLVAQHVAEMVGIKVTRVVTGREMENMLDEALWQTADSANVFAEVAPNDKELIIKALQKRGHVVGFLGDGINDAPALYAADVGISVESAVDVAKEAADFVLLHQDLECLRRGILLGRTTFANTLKYIFTTTSANFGNMFSTAGASLFLPFLPLLPRQILLNNFLSDFPAMTIATDSVDEDMIERPHKWDMHFIRDFIIQFGLVSAIFDFITFGVLLLVLRATPEQFRTGWFVESCMTELLVALVVRTRKVFFRSKPGKYLFITTVIVAIVVIIIPYLPYSNLMGFTPLPLWLLLTVLGISFIYMFAAELTKKFFYAHLRTKGHEKIRF